MTNLASGCARVKAFASSTVTLCAILTRNARSNLLRQWPPLLPRALFLPLKLKKPPCPAMTSVISPLFLYSAARVGVSKGTVGRYRRTRQTQWRPLRLLHLRIHLLCAGSFSFIGMTASRIVSRPTRPKKKQMATWFAPHPQDPQRPRLQEAVRPVAEPNQTALSRATVLPGIHSKAQRTR